MLLSYLLPVTMPKIIISIIGLIIGFSMPVVATLVNKYKLNKYDREYDEDHEYKGYTSFVTAVLLFFLFYIAAAIYKMPVLLIVMIMLMLAVIGTLVDMKIRLIPNELVLIILILGIAFRILSVGFASLKGSLIALVLVIVIFGITAGITYMIRGSVGVGAGDFKLMSVIAIAVGIPGVVYFLIGLSVALVVYVIYGTLTKRLTLGSAFPMCGPIMVGFVYSLFYQMAPFLGTFGQ
ncbi:MAG: prepilin peptidase [Fusobacteria bacterium]|nr:prepilin peptidase [Fusobacteriota bacterium]